MGGLAVKTRLVRQRLGYDPPFMVGGKFYITRSSQIYRDETIALGARSAAIMARFMRGLALEVLGRISCAREWRKALSRMQAVGGML